MVESRPCIVLLPSITLFLITTVYVVSMEKTCNNGIYGLYGRSTTGGCLLGSVISNMAFQAKHDISYMYGLYWITAIYKVYCDLQCILYLHQSTTEAWPYGKVTVGYMACVLSLPYIKFIIINTVYNSLPIPEFTIIVIVSSTDLQRKHNNSGKNGVYYTTAPMLLLWSPSILCLVLPYQSLQYSQSLAIL